jgi:hypothetical protein
VVRQSRSCCVRLEASCAWGRYSFVVNQNSNSNRTLAYFRPRNSIPLLLNQNVGITFYIYIYIYIYIYTLLSHIAPDRLKAIQVTASGKTFVHVYFFDTSKEPFVRKVSSNISSKYDVICIYRYTTFVCLSLYMFWIRISVSSIRSMIPTVFWPICRLFVFFVFLRFSAGNPSSCTSTHLLIICLESHTYALWT